jgi:hypothetical protein
VEPHYDLAIIGSGSGNALVTPDFDDKRVAVIEGGTFGGTCLNVGCIPTKMFVYAADLARAVREARRYGVDATLDGVRWVDVRDRIFGRIDPISEGGKKYRLEGPNTTAYLGHARFTGDRRLAVTLPDGREERLTAAQVVIAAGAHPVVPDVVTDSGVPFHTSDTIMRIDELPERLAILGGGFIAAEMAHVFASFGVHVTVLARSSHLLRHLDTGIAQRFTDLAREQWDVRTGTNVVAVERGAGGVRLFALSDTGKELWSTTPQDAAYEASSPGPGERACGCGSTAPPSSTRTCSSSPPGGRPTRPASAPTPRACGCWRTGASRSTSSAAPRLRASGPSGTSAPPTSSSTSPTPRRGPSRTTSCTPTTCARCRTATSPRASSATRRS